jgi:hypothetical protein
MLRAEVRLLVEMSRLLSAPDLVRYGLCLWVEIATQNHLLLQDDEKSLSVSKQCVSIGSVLTRDSSHRSHCN